MQDSFRLGGAIRLEMGEVTGVCRQMLFNSRWLVLPLCVLLSLISTPSLAGAEQPYLLGVFPHLPPRELEKVFAPIAADLSKSVGHKILFRSSSTYKKFRENEDKELYDIVFTQPFDYIRVADQHGYLPLATRSEPLAALIVVKKGSPITHLEDLRGKIVALPPKIAAVSYLISVHLKKHGLIPGKDVRLVYHRSHVSCLQQVIIGAADACGTAAPALRFFNSKMNVQLSVITKTISIPHTLFAVNPHVPSTDRNKLLQAILSWGKTKEGQILLRRGRLRPFIKITDKDYDIVRQYSKELQ